MRKPEPQMRANDLLSLWQLQRRMGVRPEERRLPSDDEFERDLEIIRQCIERKI